MMHLKTEYNCLIKNYFAFLSLIKVRGGTQEYECKEQFISVIPTQNCCVV